MKAVMYEVLPEILEFRSRTGIDKWDEMWEGVLHMPPAPDLEYQDFQWELETWLRLNWARPKGRRVYHDVNVAPPGGWPNKDYRIPDLVLLAPQCSATRHRAHLEGAPTVVVEIRSPDDETMEKLPFYAKLGVPEVWVIERDTRAPVIHALSGGEYEPRKPDGDKWLVSVATGIQLRPSRRRLAIQIVDDPDTLETLPHD